MFPPPRSLLQPPAGSDLPHGPGVRGRAQLRHAALTCVRQRRRGVRRGRGVEDKEMETGGGGWRGYSAAACPFCSFDIGKSVCTEPSLAIMVLLL